MDFIIAYISSKTHIARRKIDKYYII